MKHILQLTFLAVAMTIFGGCTQNNGDIGDWFGTWRLESITVDGDPLPGYDGNITMAFQGNIVSVTVEGENHDYSQRFGTWESDASTLTLDFSHAAAPVQDNQKWQFVAPNILHINSEGITVIKITEMSAHRLSTSFIDSQGQTVGYILIKSV